MKNSKISKNIAVITSFLFISAITEAKELPKLGKEITLKEKTNVSQLLKTPKNFIGKHVLIEGKVVDVCTKRGCWMKVSSDKKKESITIKVKDGEMVFPVEARGKNVKIEGELFEIALNKEEKGEMGKDEHKKEDKKMGKDDHKHEHEKEANSVFMFKPQAVKFE